MPQTREDLLINMAQCTAGVLGGGRTLQLLTRPLSAEAAKGAGPDWRTTEAALYCVRSVSRSGLS